VYRQPVFRVTASTKVSSGASNLIECMLSRDCPISSIENIFPILWNVFPLSNEMSAQTVIIPLFSRVACNVGETSCLNS